MVNHAYKITIKCHSQLSYPGSRKSQSQEIILTRSPDKRTRKYGTDCSKRHPSISALRPKWLSPSKMKLWTIYTSLPVNVIVKLPNPRSRDSQGQQTFSAPSADSQTRKYDTECWNHLCALSILRSKKLSHRKIKWWALYTILLQNVTMSYHIFEAKIASTKNRF